MTPHTLRVLVIVSFAVLLAMPNGAVRTAAAGPGAFTGLIVVANVPHLDRSISPAVLTPEGGVVYGRGWWKPGQLNLEFVDAHGIVEYASSIEAARRAGPRPLVVMAVGVSGPPLSSFKTDVIISDEDAAKIRAANAQARFLEQFHVAIVVQPPVADLGAIQ